MPPFWVFLEIGVLYYLYCKENISCSPINNYILKFGMIMRSLDGMLPAESQQLYAIGCLSRMDYILAGTLFGVRSHVFGWQNADHNCCLCWTRSLLFLECSVTYPLCKVCSEKMDTRQCSNGSSSSFPLNMPYRHIVGLTSPILNKHTVSRVSPVN